MTKFDRVIWIKNQRYYFVDSFRDWEDAYKLARYYKKKNKSKYYIVKTEAGFWFPEIRYRLYLNKICRLFG